MRSWPILYVTALVLGVASASWAVCGVRISDLNRTPLPPNPIRVWGVVTQESPLRLSDGRAQVVATGVEAKVGDFLVLTGNLQGTTLAVTAASGFLGPARTEMIYIPAGSFMMGNNGSEPYSYPEELLQHSVSLPGYWIGKYEVTRGEYSAFMNARGYSDTSYWSSAGWTYRLSQNRPHPDYWDAVQNWGTGSFTQTDSHPVVGVSYYECEAFCNWAGGHLPTEAQWERAARWTGSYPNVYPWGNTWDYEKCNNRYDHNAAGGGYEKYQTAPVGSYPSGVSPCGLQDMAGNVWEWVQDWYVSYAGCTVPFDFTGSSRVMRGGGWNRISINDSDLFRCASRISYNPGNTWNAGGFRLVR